MGRNNINRTIINQLKIEIMEKLFKDIEGMVIKIGDILSLNGETNQSKEGETQ